MTSETPGERLKKIVDDIGGVTAAAESVGVVRKTIYDWIKDWTRIPLHSAFKICDKAGVTLEWVITGRGRSLDSLKTQRGIDDMLGIKRTTRNWNDQDIVLIRQLSIQASAGPGAMGGDLEAVDFIGIATDTFRRLGVSPDLTEVIRARGDSMLPTISDGSIILVNRSVHEFQGGGIYVFSVGEDIRLKRLQRRIDGGLIVISDNEKLYPREELPVERLVELNFTVHGKVIWTERVL